MHQTSLTSSGTPLTTASHLLNMPSYTVLLALLVTLAVPVFTQAVEVHGMQLQLGDLVPEFGSFEVRFTTT